MAPTRSQFAQATGVEERPEKRAGHLLHPERAGKVQLEGNDVFTGAARGGRGPSRDLNPEKFPQWLDVCGVTLTPCCWQQPTVTQSSRLWMSIHKWHSPCFGML